jgi:hypothetical protein
MIMAGASLPLSEQTPMQKYMFCVWDKAIEFSRTSEPAATIVDAAQTLCMDFRHAAVESGIEAGKSATSVLSPSELRRISEDTLDQYVRAKASAFVVQKRSERR